MVGKVQSMAKKYPLFCIQETCLKPDFFLQIYLGEMKKNSYWFILNKYQGYLKEKSNVFCSLKYFLFLYLMCKNLK